MSAPKIFESEYRFMQILWENEPVNSTQLVALCKERLDWSKATTYTVIRRLSERGVVVNAFNPAFCNGSLMDIGVYCIHALVALFGVPEKLSAVANRLDNGLDSQGGALCVYPEMLAELSWSKVSDSRRSNEIQGEQGTLLIDSITNPKDIVFVGRDKSRRVIYHDPDPEFFNMKHEIRSFMDFAAASAEGSRPWESYNQVTEQVLVLMDEIRSQTGIDFKNLRQ